MCVYHVNTESALPLVGNLVDIPEKRKNHTDETLQVINKIELPAIKNPPRVLYLIYTHSSNHETLCRAQLNTWGSHTQSLLFYSNEGHPELPIVNISHDGEESYENMWRKVISMVRHACKYFLDKYDWFMFGGNDLLVIPENLHRLLLQPDIAKLHAQRQSLYLGRRLKLPDDGTMFNSGGAGYVLNRHALLNAFKNIPHSEPDKATAAEDVMIAKALARSEIYPYDTRDENGAERFHPLSPKMSLNYPVSQPEAWFHQYTMDFERIAGLDGISNHSISFHYLDENLMYLLWNGFYPQPQQTYDQGT